MKRSLLLSSCCLLLLSFFFLPASYSHAQGIPVGSDLILTTSSDNPAPGQTITITATSYSFDINSATVIWTVDGTRTQSGIGNTTLSLNAPALGKKTTISVVAVMPNGSRYTNSITIGSGSIDIIVETDGYTPPFFKGKAPIVYQNDVTIIAVPHIANGAGQEYDPSTLVYQWKRDDGTVLQSQSGYGKQAITLKGALVPRPYYLIVTATPRDGSGQAQGLIQIGAGSPSILFYNKDPLYGPLFNEAVGNNLYIGAQKEATAFAALFGFNTNGLSLDWTVNGISHPELSSSPSIVLRAPDGVSGVSNVSLNVQSSGNILQGATGGFNVSFSASQNATATPIIF